MKKTIAVILSCILIFAFAGCAKNTTENFDLVLITDGASIKDKAYNQSAWNGVKTYAEEHDLSCRYYQPNLSENGDLSVETIASYIELAANGGAKYIVLPGESFSVAAYEIAPTYQDIRFILVDAYPHTQDDMSMRLQSNVMCINFNALQAGFLAGYSSVIDGYTKLGYLGSINSETSGNYGGGFVQGAAYAADQKGIPVTLDYANYDSPVLDYDYSFTIKPVYIETAQAKETTYKVTVVDGIGSGVYTDGENVTITANPAPEGKTFDHWEVKSDTEGVKDKKVNISSKKKSSMNLLVGDCDCTITAVWADAETYPVKIFETDGVTVHETINAVKDSKVWITAPAAPAGYVFDHWETSDSEAVEDINAKGTNIAVGSKGIDLLPVYTVSENPTFNVKVENGTGSGAYVKDDEITVIADPPQDGYMFYKWENVDSLGLSTGIAMENEYCYSTSFKMVDRYASIAEKMYDDGTQVIFGGGNPLSDSIFTATWNFDYPVYAFGSGTDEGSKGNCLASVVNDYGTAIKLALEEFQGGNIFSADCSNGCIYVTGKNLLEYQLDENAQVKKDKDGNEIKNSDYNVDYAAVYSALGDGDIKPTYVQTGADFRNAVHSKCLTVNYWIIENE